MIRALESWCGAFLYTNIDTEGLLLGMPLEIVSELRRATSKQLIVAGGIRTEEEVDRLHSMGVDAVVGMAIYLELLKI
jgi:phosphoribosylformimino-5-aminoimidazole carboxamide ribotide isomerase